MSKDTVALLPNTHAVRLLEDAQLFKSSLETAIRKLSNAFKRAFAIDTRGRYFDAWSRANNALVKLQSIVAREVPVTQPSSGNSFSFSLLETMSTAVGLVYFALAVAL